MPMRCSMDVCKCHSSFERLALPAHSKHAKSVSHARGQFRSPAKTQLRPTAKRRCVPVRAEASTVWTAISQLQGGSSSILNFIENAPPIYYLIYMFAAGLGMPCSEDAFVIWVGSKLWRGVYGAWQQAAYVLLIVYVGVVVSDLLTFCIGAALRRGLLNPLKDKLLPKNSASITKAEEMVTRWSNYIGAVQRFSLGFRGPLCLISGFTGVPAAKFAAGASLGALGTMPIQLTVGYFMRNTPNVYLSSLALVAIPNIVGNYLGPLAFGLVTAVRMKQKDRRRDDITEEKRSNAEMGTES